RGSLYRGRWRRMDGRPDRHRLYFGGPCETDRKIPPQQTIEGGGPMKARAIFDWLTKALPKALQPLGGTRGGGPVIVREPFTGAWQLNQEVSAGTALTYSAVFACVTLIASDIAKLGLGLVQVDEDGIWTRTESAAFSPVLRKPNRYQNRIKF